MKKIIVLIMTALSCILLLLPLGLTVYATSAETTEETTESTSVELEEGYWNTPPSWWDEELFLESAVKIIQESDNSYNQAWDGEYKYYALGIGVTPSYPDYVDFYVTFYKDEPEFFLKDGDTYGIQTNRAYYLQGTYNPTLCTERYGFQSVAGTLYHANDKDPYELIESYPDGYRIYYYEYEDFTNRIRSTTDITFFSNNVNMYEQRRYYQTTNIPSECFKNIGLNPPVSADNSDKLSVQFLPSLTGEVDRTLTQNGVEAETPYWSFTVTNNSNSNYQFMMSIVKEGTNISFGTGVSTSSGVPSNFTSVFTFICPEWHGSDGNANTIYSNFAWHKVSAKGAYTRWFSWEQLNLQKNTNYTVYVFGIPITGDYPQLGYIRDFNVDFIYSSTFTIKNPAVFNPNDNSFNNVANHTGSDLNELCNGVSGYMTDQGETIIGDYSQSSDGYFDIEYSGNSSNGNKLNQTNVEYGFNALGSMATSYFNLLNRAFVVFPSWFWSIICLSVFSVIIVGLIKTII